MTDILLRGLSPDVLTKIDDDAARRGLSRNQFLREFIERAFGDQKPRRVTVTDLERAARAVKDLGNPEIMAEAWR